MGQAGVISDQEEYQDPPFRVLVVDDSALQRRILSASLRRQGYDIVEASCGTSALDICAATPPDIVISDWMMPGMDGPEFCVRFRQMALQSYGYFILLTSKSEKGVVAQGLDCGADDFLMKPVNPGELRARLSAGERILRSQRQLHANNQRLGAALDQLRVLIRAHEQELTEAKQLQQSLVPERYRDFGRAQMALTLCPAGHVGGDLVGFFRGGADEVLLYAIDVSGHGISSALMTARMAAYLSPGHPAMNMGLQRGSDGSYRARPPHDAMARLNERLLSDMQTDHYATMVLACANVRTGHVRLCQAGHPHPLVVRADGAIDTLGDGGMPIGLIKGAEYDSVETVLNHGDRLWLLSDGVSENTDRQGAFFGEARTADLVRDLTPHPATRALDALMWHLADFAGGEDFPDDISAILWQVSDENRSQP